MTKEQRNAIKRICEDFDFENTKELKEWLKDNYGDTLDKYWFIGDSEEDCYAELKSAVSL